MLYCWITTLNNVTISLSLKKARLTFFKLNDIVLMEKIFKVPNYRRDYKREIKLIGMIEWIVLKKQVVCLSFSPDVSYKQLNWRLNVLLMPEYHAMWSIWSILDKAASA